MRSVTLYTAEHIEWIAAYDATTSTCYYIPAAELGDGCAELSLRLAPTRNNQRRGVRIAANYLHL